MPSLKLTHVISASSEDPPAFCADNLLHTEGSKKWRCPKTSPFPSQLTAVLQLEKLSLISQVDIGNDGSAFVEIQVARSADTNDDNFQTLLPAASFMSPAESRQGSAKNRVRMFSRDKLTADLAAERWDRVRIVCTQPFNKHVQYGLSFLALSGQTSGDVQVSVPSTKKQKLGAFTLKEEEPDDEPASLGGLFLARQKTETARPKMSPAAELRSGQTLATMALAKMDDKSSDDKPKRPMFYQLKKEKQESTKARSQPEANAKAAKLPRRDVMPGESPPRKRERSSEDSHKKKKIKKEDQNDCPVGITYLPFRKLFDGVVFAISGIQNPERGRLRELALEMGAKYEPDWSDSCTHLICAFANTPKFNTVKKKKGKIVKKEWIQRCHADRKRYPWRRFCLDPASKGDESESEVWDEMLQPSTSTGAVSASPKNSYEDMDTDEEIEHLKKKEESDNSDDAYNADTDVDDEYLSGEKVMNGKTKAATDHLDFPVLPNVFENRCFFLKGDFSSSFKKSVERAIVAGNGTISPYMEQKVNFVITNAKWKKDFTKALDENKKLRIVAPEFVLDSYEAGTLLNSENYFVKKS